MFIRVKKELGDAAMICLNCGEECWRDSANVGIGIIYGPWGCECGWSEDENYNILDGPKCTENGYIIDQYGGATPTTRFKIINRKV